MFIFSYLHKQLPRSVIQWINENHLLLDSLLVWCLVGFILLLPFPRLGGLKSLTRLLPLAIWLAKQTAAPETVFQGKPLFVAFLVYTAASLFSLVHAHDLAYSLDEIRGDLVFPALICFVIINNICQREQVKKLFFAFTASSLLVSCIGLVQYLLGKQVTADGRALLTFHYPTIAGIYLASLTLLALGWFGFSSSSRFKLAVIPLTVLNLVALAATQCRQGIVACGIGLFFYLHTVHRKALPLFLLGSVLLLLLLPYPMVQRISSLVEMKTYTGKKSTVNGRYLHWKTALMLIKEHPVVGQGYGWENSRRLMTAYNKTYQVLPAEPIMYHAHNVFLEILLETGLLGLAGFLAILLVLYSFLRGATVAGSSDLFVKQALIAALLCLLIMAPFDFFLRYAQVKLLWILIGLSASIANLSKQAVPGEF